MPLLLPLLLLVAVVGALDPSIEPEHVFFKANAADLYFQASCTAGPWSNAGEDVWVHDRAGATDIPLAGIVGWDAAAREMGGSIAASTTREAFAAAGQQVHRMQACFALVADDVFAEGTNVKVCKANCCQVAWDWWGLVVSNAWTVRSRLPCSGLWACTAGRPVHERHVPG